MTDFKLTANLPFSQYIRHCQSLIAKERVDAQKGSLNAELIINTNSPFELQPEGCPAKQSALLIHGLLDSPFSLKDLGLLLQREGILTKAILLPGHGTTPKNLMNATHQDWINTVRYGLDSLCQEAESVFVIGYSTGATIAAFHALTDPRIAGIILLSPAIRIKAPVDIVVGFHKILTLGRSKWLYVEDEDDYAKYQSIPFHALKEVAKMTKALLQLGKKHSLSCPLFMILSREDETISSAAAIKLFSTLKNPASRLLLYAAKKHPYADPRIMVRDGRIPSKHIRHYSHICIPFNANNPHYGEHGDYIFASHDAGKDFIYGAYNRIEVNTSSIFNKIGLTKKRRRALTYNPDFEFMGQQIVDFILSSS